ncbi:dethiobiotin synthase [Isosphaera pallida ATCC 43644]|uniref:ATP-dependent dethiobiotin synthetase BioD n=2 Tax=Isosphaera pallida TaxID=128 RepID=E8R2W0_ISOPI|nr:dethiobiotin synthase [Isosphaera pallida ATCC 43644]
MTVMRTNEPQPLTLPGLFVTGTDTGVGKTQITAALVGAAIAQGRRPAALKPVGSGAKRDAEGQWRHPDVEMLAQALGDPELDRSLICQWMLELPLAPCVAAREVGQPLEWPRLRQRLDQSLNSWRERGCDLAIVEGVGGLLCPLTDETTVADLAAWLDYPVLIVARRGLGTLNHTLMTVEAARLRGLRLAGLILNDPETPTDPLTARTNAEELSRRLPDLPIWGELDHHPAEADSMRAWSETINWFDLAASPRGR